MKPQTSGLIVGKLKRKVLREPVGVTLNGKIQGFGGNAVEFGQVCIEHDLLAADQKYSPLDLNCQGVGGLKVILQVQVSLRPSRESGIASSPMKRSKCAGSEWLT